MIPDWKVYPRSQGHSTVYLKNVISDPAIEVGEYTTYDDFEKDPRDFQRNNVLYHYPECNHDRLKIGRYCSIACGAKFMFNAANHALGALSTYPFPIFLRNGDCRRIRTPLHRRGITMGILSWATTCGSALKPSSFPA